MFTLLLIVVVFSVVDYRTAKHRGLSAKEMRSFIFLRAAIMAVGLAVVHFFVTPFVREIPTGITLAFVAVAIAALFFIFKPFSKKEPRHKA